MTKVIKLPEVIKITALSRSTIYSYIQKNSFPKPVRIGTRAVAWLETEILDFLNQKTEMRDGAK